MFRITTEQSWQYQDDALTLKIGEEMGRFKMGSTIIVLFGKDKPQWDTEFKAEKMVKLGELMSRLVG